MLHLCIDEFKSASIPEIRRCLGVKPNSTYVKGRETELISSKNGPMVMDTVFDVKVPGTDDTISVIIDIEGQNENTKYPIEKKAEYYMARLVSSQKGSDFTGTDYGDIRKTYSIWCMMDPHACDRNSMVSYSMTPHINTGNPENLLRLDTFNIIFLNLGTDYSDELPECIRFPTAVFGKRLPEDRRKEILTNNYNIPKREYPKRELVVINSIYEDTKRRYLREGREEGLEIGEKRGLEIGEKRGIEIGNKKRIEDLANVVSSVMQRLDLSLEEAMEITNISEEDRPTVSKRIQQSS